jgi:hypothetical protein
LSKLKVLFSPAAFCLMAVCVCVVFSIAGSNASRNITFRQETKFGYATASFPIHMRRRDEELFAELTARAKSEMAEFLRGAEQDAQAKLPQSDASDWKPYVQSVRYISQFHSLTLVSYLQVTTVTQGEGEPVTTFKTINFDKTAKRELTLGDLLEGAADRSKPLEALASYTRSDLKDRTGENDDDDDSENNTALMDMSKADLGVYERFTFCPSTQIGKAAGLTIHFPPASSGPYAGTDFHVTIPYSVFSRYLKPGMKSLFAGEPRQAPVDLDDGA